MKSLLELMRRDEPPPPIDPMSAANGAGPSGPSSAGANRQRAPVRRPTVKACAICQSRKYSRVSIADHRKFYMLIRCKCDGQNPSCKSCADKGWPCFYLSDGPNGESQIVVYETPPAPSVHPDLLQQSAMASTLTSANEDLQRELDQARNKLADAEKRAFELQSNLTETNKQMDQLRTENTRLKAVAQASISLKNTNHERRNNNQQQTAKPKQPVTIPPPPQPPGFHPHTQYPAPTNQMYHGQPTPSQGEYICMPSVEYWLINNSCTSCSSLFTKQPPNALLERCVRISTRSASTAVAAAAAAAATRHLASTKSNAKWASMRPLLCSQVEYIKIAFLLVALIANLNTGSERDLLHFG